MVSPFGYGSKLKHQRPQVQALVSIYQGKPFWGCPVFDPQPFGSQKPKDEWMRSARTQQYGAGAPRSVSGWRGLGAVSNAGASEPREVSGGTKWRFWFSSVLLMEGSINFFFFKDLGGSREAENTCLRGYSFCGYGFWRVRGSRKYWSFGQHFGGSL